MTTPPFGATTPLTDSPYLSRLPIFTLNTVDIKNYPLIAFKPGFPLQAAELNELQENFAIQQTLSNTLLTNWLFFDTSLVLTGSATDIYSGPGWNGAIPLHPNQIIVSGAGVSASVGWYLITLPISNLKFWVYNATELAPNRNALNPNYFYGFSATSSYVPCSNDDRDEGWNFNDQSSGNFASSTCGANRFKITLSTAIATTNSSTINFLPITKVTSGLTPNMIRFMNNKFIATV